jgi:hypothetical protein
MRAIYIAPALLLSALAMSPASAAPAAALNGATAVSPLVQVQYSHKSKQNHARPSHARYQAGHRYRSAPHGWHRYSRRPGDWQHRGCVLVGPVWFCP